MGVLECREEEEFVSAIEKPGYPHRSAEGAAILILVQRVLRRGEEVIGVKKVVADELKRRSVKAFVPDLVTIFTRPPASLPACPPSAEVSTLNCPMASGKGRDRRSAHVVDVVAAIQSPGDRIALCPGDGYAGGLGRKFASGGIARALALRAAWPRRPSPPRFGR